MDEQEFSIKRIKGSFSSSEDIILEETSTTCLVFRPKVHNGGVRGELIRFKKEQGKLIEPEHINFTKLNLEEGTHTVLSTQAVTKIVKRVHDLYVANKQVSPWKLQQGFKVARAETVIDDTNKAKAIKQLLDKGYSDDFWDELVASDPDLATRLSWAKIYGGYDLAIKEFRASITSQSSDEAYWQEFFEKYPWILQQAFSYPVLFLQGETYVGGKKAKGRQGVGGVATDFIFTNESSRSFAVVEIKTPDTHLIGSIYRGEEGSGDTNEVYSMHAHLSGALVQTQNQIKVASSSFTTTLKDTFDDDMNATHPHGILVIGKLDNINDAKLRSLNHFRFAVKDITIITFDELLRRIEAVIAQTTPDSVTTRVVTTDISFIDRTMATIRSEDLPF